MAAPFTPPTVVVGVDGSPAATRAAVWAVDEAVSRNIPLRLVGIAEPLDVGGDPAAPAGEAVRAAAAAVQATGRAVKLETEVVAGAPTLTLLEESRSAAMVCVGAVGLRHLEHHRIGSTATALVASAHCPVAVVRCSDRSADGGEGWVVVDLDDTPDSAAVLQFGVEEARLRGAPLRVLGAWQSRYTDVHDSRAVADGNRMVRAQLDRRLAQWKHNYPDLDVRPVAVHGSVLNWLARHSADIQLVVLGARNATAVAELLGPNGLAALHDTDCSVLVVDPQRLL